MQTKPTEPAAQVTISGALLYPAELHNMREQGYKLDLLIGNANASPYLVEHWYVARPGVSNATLGHIADRSARTLCAGAMVTVRGSLVIPGRWRARDVLRVLIVDQVEWANMAADHRIPGDLTQFYVQNGASALSSMLGGIAA